MASRWDETWHRLREWTNGQGPSERLAAQILADSSYVGIDPSHPLGGKDGTKDAVCKKDNERWIMAVYFPRGQQSFNEIKTKYESDLAGVSKNNAVGIAFVTNQELRLAEREELRGLSENCKVDLFHLERVTLILDKPAMSGVRRQFLGIDENPTDTIFELRQEISTLQIRLEGLQTGGDSFCYLMFYDFDLSNGIAKNFVVIKKGEYPLYDVRIRICNMGNKHEILRQWGEISAPAEYELLQWPLQENEYYRVFIHARNGQWHQDLILKRSESAKCWLAATKVFSSDGNSRFEHIDAGYKLEFGSPDWRK